VIGQQFGHGEDKNTAAQLVSHAILGATLAYINGGDPTAGGSAAVASEAAAIYLTNQYKDKKEYQDANGEFQPNLLPENVKAQIRDLTAGIGAVIGGAAGDSSYNAQLAGVIGQNAVENNVDSYKDIQNAKAYSEQMYKDACVAYGLSGAACNEQIRKDGYEILQATALILLPTEPYEYIPLGGKAVGIVIKGTKKLKAVFKNVEEAQKAADKAKVKVDDKFIRNPNSLQDKLTLDAAKSGEGVKIMSNMGDPRYKGWDKYEYKTKSSEGFDSVVHYVKNPNTGEVADFKFKKRATDGISKDDKGKSKPVAKKY
jgi:hypothetical protein